MALYGIRISGCHDGMMHRKVKLSDDDDDDEEADAEQRTTTRRCNNKVPILPILPHLGAICLDSRRGNLFLHRFLHATLSTLASQDMLTHTNHQRWLRTTAELLLYRDPRSFCHYTYTVFDACPETKCPLHQAGWGNYRPCYVSFALPSGSMGM